MLGLSPQTRVLRRRQPNFSADAGYSAAPGKGAPAEAQRLWNESYNASLQYYQGQKAPDPKNIASNTAWKRLLMNYDRSWRGKLTRRNPAGEIQAGTAADGQPAYFGETPEPLPDLGKTTRLGKLVEVAWIDAQGNLRIQRFGGSGLPDLAWDKELKTLIMFPGEEAGFCDPDLTGLGAQAKMFEVWSRRDAHCQAPLPVPNVSVSPVGVADTLVYRSDKWEDKPNPHPDLLGSQEYVHQFDDNVFVEESGRQGSKPPAAILVSGGRLDVQAGGIVH